MVGRESTGKTCGVYWQSGQTFYRKNTKELAEVEEKEHEGLKIQARH